MGVWPPRLARPLTGMRALVIGASGLVGGALLDRLGADGVGTYRSQARPGLRPLDAANRRAVDELLLNVCPSVVFFPAGDPNVERCEQDEPTARRANLDPLRVTLDAIGDVPIVAYSTDYVFDGTRGPYVESDALSPLSAYGRIKVELESLVLERGGTVIRPTGIFGWEPAPGKNFVMRVAASLRRGERIRVPNDQIANPTYVEDLAAASIEIARGGERGIWHVAGADLIARDAFARLVAEIFELDATLVDPVPTSALGQLAPRPLRGGLRCMRYEEHFGVPPIRSVRDALAALRTRLEVTT